MLNETNLAVGTVANRCGVNVSTLHFYEEKGLIQSWRNPGNQRRYKRDVIRRISIIKAAQKMGISLEEIKSAFDRLPENRTPTKTDWAKLSRAWQKQLNARIAYMERLRDSLNGCIGCGCMSLKNCPIHNPDDEMSLKGNGPVILDKRHR